MTSFRTKFAVLFMAVLLLIACAVAQSNSDQSQTTDQNQTSDSTTQLNDQSGGTNPTRVIESHKVVGGRTVDVHRIERMGTEGRYELFSETETETVPIDATTTRTLQRQYSPGADGGRTLTGVSEEERHESADGGESLTRTFSNVDSDGQRQVTQKEVQQTVQTSPDVKTTNTTVFLPGADGLTPSTRTQEVQTKTDNGVDYHKSVSMPDGSGKWEVNEVRDGSIRKNDDQSQTKEEKVSRRDANGNLTPSERTVTKLTKDADGRQNEQTQYYSNAVGGVTSYGDGQLHLDRDTTTITLPRSDGGQTIETQVNQRNAVAPGDHLQTSERIHQSVGPDVSGTQQNKVSIESAGPGGDIGTVWVDTRKTVSSGTTNEVSVDTRPSTKQPAQSEQTKSPEPEQK